MVSDLVIVQVMESRESMSKLGTKGKVTTRRAKTLHDIKQNSSERAVSVSSQVSTIASKPESNSKYFKTILPGGRHPTLPGSLQLLVVDFSPTLTRGFCRIV
jgi:hypothetical protein